MFWSGKGDALLPGGDTAPHTPQRRQGRRQVFRAGVHCDLSAGNGRGSKVGRRLDTVREDGMAAAAG